MRKHIIWLNFLLTIFLLLGCSLGPKSTKKPFYQTGSGWDYLRFPLLEPYYAIKIDDEHGWTIPLYAKKSQTNFWYYFDVQDVRKIAVKNNVIMLYSAYSKPITVNITDDGKEENKELHWFILIPDQTERGFETEKEFIVNLQQFGIEQPEWREPLSILQKFDQTRCLEWIPGCK